VRRALFAILLALAAAPRSLPAQTVLLAGSGEPAIDHRLRELIAARGFRLIRHDTLIAAGDTVAGSLLVVDATLYLEGTVRGDLAGVRSNLFLRPTAHVHGAVINAGGGLYRSALAGSGQVLDHPLAAYDVAVIGDTLRITGRPSGEPGLRFPGFLGLRPPTYDRVAGLTLPWGAAWRLARAEREEAWLRSAVAYRTAPGDIAAAAALDLQRGRTRLSAAAEQAYFTNDEWIRSDLDNSLVFAWSGRDLRNYYRAERFYAEAGHAGERRRWAWQAALRAQTEKARSLPARDPWTLFGDGDRRNPPIDDGRTNSIVGQGAIAWHGESAALRLGTALEAAADFTGGDFSFARFILDGDWTMLALRDHTLEIEWRFQGPLPGTRSLPRQRWTFVGGSGTLKTFPIAHFPGDRLVFVETDYIIPLPASFRFPILGAPALEIEHAAAMAWTANDRPPLEQNVALRLQFFGLYARVVTNPARLADSELDFGLEWPFDRSPRWERDLAPEVPLRQTLLDR
jgi:hypothetical protein